MLFAALAVRSRALFRFVISGRVCLGVSDVVATGIAGLAGIGAAAVDTATLTDKWATTFRLVTVRQSGGRTERDQRYG